MVADKAGCSVEVEGTVMDQVTRCIVLSATENLSL